MLSTLSVMSVETVERTVPCKDGHMGQRYRVDQMVMKNIRRCSPFPAFYV